MRGLIPFGGATGATGRFCSSVVSPNEIKLGTISDLISGTADGAEGRAGFLGEE